MQKTLAIDDKKDNLVTLSALREERDSLERTLQERAADLSRSEEKYRTLVESISDVIFEVDSQGLITYVSPVAKDVLGYDQGDIIGKNFIELVYLADRELLIKRFMELGVGVEYPLNYRIINKSGDTRWVRTRTRPVMKDGRFTGARGTLIDITDQKRTEEALRESETRYRAIYTKSPIAIEIYDAAGLLVDVNPACIDLFGVNDAQELRGFDIFNDPNLKEEYKQSLRNGNTVRYQAIFDFDKVRKLNLYRTSRTGSIWLDVLITPLGGESFSGYLVQVHGITAHKLAEEKLQDTLLSLRKAVNATIQVMVSAVEARDPYTAGHQTRSADLARAIAAEMGLSPEMTEGLRMAGCIHDIGKLSIPAEILSKPTNLTEIEYSLIKEHSRNGHEILKDVESPWPLAEIIYQHHERMDGSGYPRNLKGEEICMEARILAVADVVESMASHRPYRAGLGIDVALEEIEKNRGIFYDNNVADACLRLFREKGFKLEISSF
jgi:PAS domain S-box-containing protein